MNQPFNFTRKQREIAEMIRRGHTVDSMAKLLVIEKTSVKSQLSYMYRLAHVHSFGELKTALLRDRQPAEVQP